MTTTRPYTCVTCGDTADTAKDAAKHGRMHSVAEFSRTAKVEAIPSWTVDCSGTCNTFAVYHIVVCVDEAWYCNCPADTKGKRQNCRHIRACKAQGRVLPNPKVAETLARLVEAGIGVLDDPIPSPHLKVARLRPNYRAIATQLDYATRVAPGEPDHLVDANKKVARAEPVPISRAARERAEEMEW